MAAERKQQHKCSIGKKPKTPKSVHKLIKDFKDYHRIGFEELMGFRNIPMSLHKALSA
jgi:hypothetical protein